jgi:hypothetical protein
MEWMNYLYVTLVGGRKEKIRLYKDSCLVDNWGQMFKSMVGNKTKGVTWLPMWWN